MTTLGTLLKQKRIAEKWTQEDIATRAGRYRGSEVDQTHVSYWERDGIKRPTGEQLRMLAHAYELPVVDLVIAAGYLRRADLAEVPDAPPSLFTEPPEDDPVALLDRIVALTVRLDALVRADRDRESRGHRRNNAS